MNVAERSALISLLASAGCVSGSTPADTDGGSSETSSSTDDPASSSSMGSGLPESTSSSSSSSSAISDTTSSGTADTDDSSSSSGTTEATGGEDESSTGSTGDTEGTGGASGPFVEACEALFEAYSDCFDYGPLPPGYCEQVAEEYASYGEACQGAIADLWACLSEADCEAFETDTLPPECAEVGLEGHEACPELIPFCSVGGAGGGEDECFAESFGCLDGREYAVSCDTDTCSCTIDGDPAGSFPGDAASCLAVGFAEDTVEHCGFPEGAVLE